jgi:sucrose-6-phosphate hydrolase SacC (GH32 family)
MKLPIPLASLTLALATLHAPAAGLFREPWRPQFHFTPERNWMNDPNGMLFYEGEYHLFYQYNPFGDRWGHMSWGHAVSTNLTHWQHLPVALLEENGVMIFSGSAAVDWRNTSGFGREGRPPLVAIYTGHHTRRPLQNQHLAYSNDRGRTWTKFAGNPVLDLGEADFRDPKVFWHEPTGRWVMVVAWPVHRKVRFYSSPNLNDWTHLSDFGPAGSTAGIWECPDLFPLPVEGGGAPRTKWTLIVNVGSGAPAGGSGCQYFVGEFDGTQFTLDATYPKPVPESVPEGRVLADFEGGDYAGWRAAGTAFGDRPAAGTLPNQQAVDGFRGRGLVNSYLGGDGAVGELTSPEFEVTHHHLSFLIGGGNHAGQTGVNLRVGGEVVRTATGDNAERLAWKSWDVSEFRGRRAVLEIVDRHTGGWGHVNVDHFLLADAPARPATVPALWADWGRDFYAAVSWSDIPPADGRRLWIGWMSNWEYANDVPTSPWRSAMSVPRELILRDTPAGLRLVQRPVHELQGLRGEARRFPGGTVAEAAAWLAAQTGLGELQELSLELEPAEGFTLELLTGDREATRLTADPGAGRLRLDRTASGRADFHAKFPGVHEGPLRLVDGRLRLHLLLDTSSLEVFAADGETVLTSLILPTGPRRDWRLSADGAGRVHSLELRPLRSIWPAAR